MSTSFLTESQALVKLGYESITDNTFITKSELAAVRAKENLLNDYLANQYVIDDHIERADPRVLYSILSPQVRTKGLTNSLQAGGDRWAYTGDRGTGGYFECRGINSVGNPGYITLNGEVTPSLNRILNGYGLVFKMSRNYAASRVGYTYPYISIQDIDDGTIVAITEEDLGNSPSYYFSIGVKGYSGGTHNVLEAYFENMDRGEKWIGIYVSSNRLLIYTDYADTTSLHAFIDKLASKSGTQVALISGLDLTNISIGRPYYNPDYYDVDLIKQGCSEWFTNIIQDGLRLHEVHFVKLV